MTGSSQAVYFNGVPLLVLASLYLGVSAAITPSFVRRRAGVTLLDGARALLFPCIGIAAALAAAAVLDSRTELAGSVWLSLAAIVVAGVPGVLFALPLGDRVPVAGGLRRTREAEERALSRERELRAIEVISAALARAGDAESVARVLLDEVAGLFSVEFVGLALVDDELNEAVGLLARRDGEDLAFWRGLRFDLRREPSGIAGAAFDGAPVTVYDTDASPLVNHAVAAAVGAQSAAFVPLVSAERVIGVLVIATTHERRAFSTEELSPLRTLAAEAALALERARSASALEEALERERFVVAIAHRVRSELDLDAVLRVAVDETARALGLSRCFVCLGDHGALTLKAQAGSAAPIPAELAERLPVSGRAMTTGTTVAVADVGAELAGDGRDVLLGLDSRSVLATPIAVFDRTIGVFALHRDQEHAWSRSEQALAEAVARELGLGIHTARLLGENRLSLERQRALLDAAQVVGGELHVRPVLQALVDQAAALLDAEAADCCLFSADRSVLCCAAERGLGPDALGGELPAGRGLAGRAIAEGVPVVGDARPAAGERWPESAVTVVAPMTWAGETRGVLRVGSSDPDRVFSAADLDALATFATVATLALRNAESFEEREHLARVEGGFSRIASLLAEPVSVTATLDAVAQAASEAFAADRVAVIAADPEGYRLAGAHAVHERLRDAFEYGLPRGAEALDHAAREGRPVASAALATDARFGQPFVGATEASSLLAIPIAAPRRERHALALVLFTEPRTFTDDDLDLAGQLASRAKAALERSELFDVERRSRLLAQQLAQSGGLFSGELEPEAVLAEVVEQASVLIRADAASIRLLDGEDLVVAATMGMGASQARGSRVSAESRPAGSVVDSRAAVAIEHIGGERAIVDGDPMIGDRYASYLAVPLLGAEGDLQGVLAVYGRRPRAWQEEEVEALNALAANASVAFAKAELYQQVELERERSVAILANVADGIVAVDRDEQIVLWNDAAERITGVPSEEALGRTVPDVLQRELRSESGTVAGDRLVPIRRGDHEIWLSLTEAVMRDPVGETAGRIFAFRDISSERVVEQMRSDFVTTVSHELRAPLTSIYGFAATLLREDVQFDAEERRTFLSYIESEAGRLTTIVDKLLSVARLDAGELHLEIEPVDVRSLVAEVAAGARDVFVNDHELVVELPESPLALRTDPDKLRQVLTNLLDNAAQFSPGGGRVTIGAARRGETIVFSVVDQGIGIPDAEQDRIFSKFYRVGDAQTGGTGVGLFIAQGLVSALGGRISVRSWEGRGSSFLVELPAGDGGGRDG